MTKPITDRPLATPGPKPMPYDEPLAVELCERITQGEGFEEICRDPRFPSETTIRRWIAVNPTFKQAYAHAREAQMDKWSDDVVEIADDATNDYMDRITKDGGTERMLDPENIMRSKLRIDTRMRLMSKLAPKTYGDKVDLNVSGSVEVSALSDEELEARTRARLVDLGVEVAGPLLLALPGTASSPASSPEPEPAEVIEPAGPEPASRPASTRKKSANDLLGLVV